MPKNITGHNNKTKDSFLLNAGAFFKNFNIDTDTFETAMKAGKCLGATQGGGKFEAVPETRNIEIDGADPETVIDAWKVTVMANLIEIKPDTLKLALGTGVISTNGENYYVIRAKRMVDSSDFIDNITWVGTLSGSNEPVIIQIYNTISTSGLSVNMAPKGQAVLSVTFAAKSDPAARSDDNDFAPFSIYYPMSMARIEFDNILDTSTTITGKALTGATVTISGGTISAKTSALAADGKFSVDIPMQESGTQINGYQTQGKRRSQDTVTYVEADLSEDDDDYDANDGDGEDDE